jgi:predicted amidohydrolase
MVPAYFIGKEPIDPKLIAQVEGAISAIARRHGSTIVYGTARIDEAGRTFNSAFVIGPDGTRLGHADKRFLWHFDRHWFTPGTELEPITTSLGRLGVLICADGRIPTIAATLVERGAEILVMPTAWVSSGRDPSSLENVQADLFAPIRAKENAVPFLAANKVGVEANSIAYCGKSLILAADGTILAQAGERDECLISATITVGSREKPPTPLALEAPAHRSTTPPRNARIAISPSDDPREVLFLSRHARFADADLLIARTTCDEAELPILDTGSLDMEDASLVRIAGIWVGIVGSAALRRPRALVAARLSGVDLFIWPGLNDAAQSLAFTRTRAMELRAFVITVTPQRITACDPDGVIVCGTFGDYRVAAFTYDRTRSEQTHAAPHTDVLEGLREAEELAAFTPMI